MVKKCLSVRSIMNNYLPSRHLHEQLLSSQHARRRLSAIAAVDNWVDSSVVVASELVCGHWAG